MYKVNIIDLSSAALGISEQFVIHKLSLFCLCISPRTQNTCQDNIDQICSLKAWTAAVALLLCDRVTGSEWFCSVMTRGGSKLLHTTLSRRRLVVVVLCSNNI